ncbi:MAG TPA: hypothetical protein VNH18_11360 [Bryobacteraceae bacterium]|nr:hypothetical protein [Bryobacteraceae bacterium]
MGAAVIVQERFGPPETDYFESEVVAVPEDLDSDAAGFDSVGFDSDVLVSAEEDVELPESVFFSFFPALASEAAFASEEGFTPAFPLP